MRQLCPHVEAPYSECYVNGLSSSSVESVITFCGGDFEKCDIYLTHHEEKWSSEPAKTGLENVNVCEQLPNWRRLAIEAMNKSRFESKRKGEMS